MRLPVFALIILALSGACAPMEPVRARAAAMMPFGDPVQVTVTRDGTAWTADYAFDRDAPVWAFTRSALRTIDRQPWRLDQWTVLTPGVVLERQGAFDVLRAVDGGPVPRQVRLAMRPRAEDLEADYRTLVFSDGSVALPGRIFDVFPLGSLAEARAMPGDLNGVDLDVPPARVTWRDAAGPVLFEGERRGEVTTRGADTYLLFGRAEIVEGRAMTTVIDPALPSWIGGTIGAFAPEIIAYYEDRLGAGQTDRPTVMVSWTGPSPGVTSMSGSVMPGLIVMSFEGAGVLSPTAEMRTVSRWFIGHESAHFWLGQTVRYEFARDAWITEGGADLMAVRALAAIDPDYDARAELQKEVDDCVRLAAGRPVASAGERGEHRAYYACGAVWAMAAEGALRQGGGGDWLDYLRPLLDANRADGVLTREEWLGQLTRVSRDPSLRLDIERMLDDGVGDPAAVIARLFDRTGVAHRVEAGRVLLI